MPNSIHPTRNWLEELDIKRMPWRSLARVWHVGSLDPVEKKTGSLEGNGLSVSLHPEAWRKIAKLGSAPAHQLVNPKGRFLHFRQLTEPQREALVAWGLGQNWLVLDQTWELSWREGKTEPVLFTTFDDPRQAQAEADFLKDGDALDVTLAAKQSPRLTARAVERIGFAQHRLLSLDMTACFWVEDCTEADGVWWNDSLRPFSLSAPRGVINLKSLTRWHRTTAG